MKFVSFHKPVWPGFQVCMLLCRRPGLLHYTHQIRGIFSGYLMSIPQGLLFNRRALNNIEVMLSHWHGLYVISDNTEVLLSGHPQSQKHTAWDIFCQENTFHCMELLLKT